MFGYGIVLSADAAASVTDFIVRINRFVFTIVLRPHRQNKRPLQVLRRPTGATIEVVLFGRNSCDWRALRSAVPVWGQTTQN